MSLRKLLPATALLALALAAVVPAVAQRLGGLLRQVVIVIHHGRIAHQQHTLGVGTVHELHTVERDRIAERSRRFGSCLGERILEGAERDRVYAAQVARYPFFADYQQRAARTIVTAPEQSDAAKTLDKAENLYTDGKLDEAEWQSAPPADQFVQQQPREGAPATPEHQSEIRFLYDDEYLYIGATFYENEPNKLVVNELKRDFNARAGDLYVVVLDTFLDKRPYFFAFLVSLVHDLTGYRIANIFLVNVALAPALFGLVYWFARALTGRRGPASRTRFNGLS